MMNYFLSIINMIVPASFMIIGVLGIRLLLKNASKRHVYILSLVILVRLLMPISLETVIGFMPSNSQVVISNLFSSVQSSGVILSLPEQSTTTYLLGPVVEQIEVPFSFTIDMFYVLWLVGVVVMISYQIYRYIQLKQRVANAKHREDNVYVQDVYDTAFVLGVIKPKVYLPTGLSPNQEEYILLHEQMHIQRYDYLVRFLHSLALAIYWFHPLVWIYDKIACYDMEMSCDEMVIERLGKGYKKSYCNSLLQANSVHVHFGHAVAFNKQATKNRIKNVLQYKKPSVLVSVSLLVLVLVGSICIVTSPKDEINKQTIQYNIIKNEYLSNEETVESSLDRIYYIDLENLYFEDSGSQKNEVILSLELVDQGRFYLDDYLTKGTDLSVYQAVIEDIDDYYLLLCYEDIPSYVLKVEEEDITYSQLIRQQVVIGLDDSYDLWQQRQENLMNIDDSLLESLVYDSSLTHKGYQIEENNLIIQLDYKSVEGVEGLELLVKTNAMILFTLIEDLEQVTIELYTKGSENQIDTWNYDQGIVEILLGQEYYEDIQSYDDFVSVISTISENSFYQAVLEEDFDPLGKDNIELALDPTIMYDSNNEIISVMYPLNVDNDAKLAVMMANHCEYSGEFSNIYDYVDSSLSILIENKAESYGTQECILSTIESITTLDREETENFISQDLYLSQEIMTASFLKYAIIKTEQRDYYQDETYLGNPDLQGEGTVGEKYYLCGENAQGEWKVYGYYGQTLYQ